MRQSVVIAANISNLARYSLRILQQTTLVQNRTTQYARSLHHVIRLLINYAIFSINTATLVAQNFQKNISLTQNPNNKKIFISKPIFKGGIRMGAQSINHARKKNSKLDSAFKSRVNQSD